MLKISNKDIAPQSCQILHIFAYSLPISLYPLYKLFYIILYNFRDFVN